MTVAHDKILGKILKLFALGKDDRNVSEEETLLAMTKAKELMARHNIGIAEVEAKANGTANAEQIRWNIRHQHTYTRKMRNFASYDNNVMVAIGLLTETRPIVRQVQQGGSHYVHLMFVGHEPDAALASELYMHILESVRRAARFKYGGGWSKQHTSYALGFGHRLVDRARAMVQTFNVTDANTLAMVVRSKDTAIQEDLAKHEVKDAKKRNTHVDPFAYTSGYQDGGRMSLNKKIIG